MGKGVRFEDGDDGEQPGPGQGGSGLVFGYTPEELAAIPEDAYLGWGCGNPAALAGLKPDETVLDLGSGAGIDSFDAAARVGPAGRVIGVDRTPETIARARANARRSGAGNVEFRVGEIEDPPVADGSVDVVISNCVINLSTDKPRVFREAFRVLRPGGRMVVCDLALERPLARAIQGPAEAYVAYVAGALVKDAYLGLIRAAGFEGVTIISEKPFPDGCVIDDAEAPELVRKLKIRRRELEGHAVSALSLAVKATKPGT